MMKKLTILLWLIYASFSCFAQEASEQEFEDAPAPPDIPPALETGAPIEPEVTIIRRDEEVIEEYRVNGVLYMVKVTPKVGKPYYLIDGDGDGKMETRSSLYNDPVVPQWVIFSW